MAWHREGTKPLPGSAVIQDIGAYKSLSDWLSWLLKRIGKIYPCGEKTVLFEHTRDTFTPELKVGNSDPSGWVEARDGMTIFCKIPNEVTIVPPDALVRQATNSLNIAK